MLFYNQMKEARVDLIFRLRGKKEVQHTSFGKEKTPNNDSNNNRNIEFEK